MAQVHHFLTEVPRFPGFLKIRLLAITRGLRQAAHGCFASGGGVARWAWLKSDERARMSCGCVLAITRG